MESIPSFSERDVNAPNSQETASEAQIIATRVGEASAENILQASIEFHSNYSSQVIQSNQIDQRREIYPSIEDFNATISSEGGKEDESKDAAESPIIMVPVATLPTAAAEAYVETDEPVLQKLMEEDQLTNRAILESFETQFRPGVGYVDSKPSEEANISVPLLNNHDNTVEAQLLGNSTTHLNENIRDFTTNLPRLLLNDVNATVATVEETTAEVTILNSPESTTIIGDWINESSLQATILDAPIDHESSWTTQEQDGFCEEISVIGRDEAEATVVDIVEDIHPADLEASGGVRAELIGREFSYTELPYSNNTQQNWHEAQHQARMQTNNHTLAFSSTATDQVDCEADAIIVDSNNGFIEPDNIIPDIQSGLIVSESSVTERINETQPILISVNEDVPLVDLSHAFVDTTAYSIGSYSGFDSTLNSYTQDMVNGTPQQTPRTEENYAPITIPDPTNSMSMTGSDLPLNIENRLSNDRDQATILSISEEIHPADLDFISSAEAEFVREDCIRSISIDEQHNLISNNLTMSNSRGSTLAYEEAAVDEAQVTAIELSEEIHPADLEGPGVQAEYVGRDCNHTETIQGSQVPMTLEAPTIINILEDEDSGSVQAKIIGGMQSTQELQVHVLPLISPIIEISNPLLAPIICQNNPDLVGIVLSDESESQEPATIAQPITDNTLLSPIVTTINQLHTSDICQFPNISVEGEQLGVRVGQGGTNHSSTTINQGGNNRFYQPQQLPNQVLSNVSRSKESMLRTTSYVMEKIFGREGNNSTTDEGFPLMPRTFLPSCVYLSKTTGMWVTTLNTDQKAVDGDNNIMESSKSLRAFSVPTKEQAEAIARAWAPPSMMDFSDNPFCFICKAQFAVFRRPCHCKNCGVCICSGCTIQWPSKMIPDTYNIKKESMINVCKSCDWLCSAFRMSLLEGDHDHSIAIHVTGNVNLTNPFANVKGELFYPVHCAVLGGSLSLLKWLIDTQCCPLRSIRISCTAVQSRETVTPILTSFGRSLLGIAMEKESMDLLRYLVVEKGMNFTNEKDLKVGTLAKMLEKTLRALHLSDVSASENHNNSDINSVTRSSFNGSLPANHLNPVTTEGKSDFLSDANIRADEALALELSEQQKRELYSEESLEDEVHRF